MIDQATLTALIFERYAADDRPLESDREHIAALVSLASDSYDDLMTARTEWDFTSNRRDILAAGRAFDNCSGYRLKMALIELARESYGKDEDTSAALILVLGALTAAVGVCDNLESIEISARLAASTAAKGGPTP